MFYRIEETEFHGRAMVAAETLQPGPHGLTILEEDALLAIPPRDSPEDLSGELPSILDKFDPQIWTDWWAFRQASPDRQYRILHNMYHEMDCEHAVWLSKYLTEKQQLREEEKLDDEDLASIILDRIEDFVKFTMVIRFNSVDLHPPSDDGSGPGIYHGHGVFEDACKMSHSCKPNCVWHTSQDGRSKTVRAIEPIRKGQEITIDYLGGDLESMVQRRRTLLSSKGFVCHCVRCTRAEEKGDDTRRFKCTTHSQSQCQGVHFLLQATETTKAELSDCNCCGERASQDYIDQVLDLESHLHAEMKELHEKIVNTNENVSERIERLKPPHDLHCLAEQCYMMQGEHYSRTNQYHLAAKAYAKQVECRLGILGDNYFTEGTAWTVERLGDALRHINLEEAEEAYKRSIRTLDFMRGGSCDPYSKCVMEKVSWVQNYRQENSRDNLPYNSGVCGIAAPPHGPPTTEDEDPCELCGNPSQFKSSCCYDVSYCCQDHRKIHWNLVHEQHCPCRPPIFSGPQVVYTEATSLAIST